MANQIARKDVRADSVVFGDEQILRKLDEIGNKITASEIDDAVKEGSKIIKKEMEKNASKISRRVANHIVIETIEKKRYKVEQAVAPDRDRFWAKFHELGADPGPPRRPFMKPAFKKKGPEAHKKIGDVLWDKITEVT